MKVKIGWTVLRGGKTIPVSESQWSRVSKTTTPVYDTIGKARGKATRLGLTYDAIVEVFIELPDPTT